MCPLGQINMEMFDLVGTFLRDGEFSDNAILKFETDLLTNLGYWNMKNKFSTEEESRKFIESIIERKIKSRVIGNFDTV